jgi:hypothetical protein
MINTQWERWVQNCVQTHILNKIFGRLRKNFVMHFSTLMDKLDGTLYVFINIGRVKVHFFIHKVLNNV